MADLCYLLRTLPQSVQRQTKPAGVVYFNDPSGDISILKSYFGNCQHSQNSTMQTGLWLAETELGGGGTSYMVGSAPCH